ncbi:MAG: hypothetical protein FJY86_00115 [Candidatus Diapherotrites archaeon]|uniref:Uncharacterized protein n=1 Tax=Candidatus Iainarchaeum sp. TaxID=3101447 RepID=A0A8T4C5E9_9ARCH|nr:hypothetical protein [Candidatus Diapherotrites archaeon]
MHFPIRLLIGLVFLVMISPTIFAADVYILRAITVPQTYLTGYVDVEITIENVQFNQQGYGAASSGNQLIHTSIRNDKGQFLPGFDDYQTSIPLPAAINVINVTIPQSSLNAGEIYTIQASIDPYNPNGTTYDETTKGNNSARKTFTVLKAPQTYQVPDMPFELSFAGMLLVLSGLFYYGRVKKNN